MDNCQPQSLAITNCHGDVDLRIERLDNTIELKIFQPTPTGLATLQCLFAYQPAQHLTPIHLVTEGHGDRIRRLYGETWIDNSDEPTVFKDQADPDERLIGAGFKITKEHVDSVCQIVGNSSRHYSYATISGLRAPMEFLYYAATPSIMRVLSSTVLGDGALSTVHLYNKMALVDGTTPLMVGDKISSSLHVGEIVNTASGKRLTIVGILSRSGQAVAHIETAFLCRNFAVCIDKAFKRASQQWFTIQLATESDVAVLEAKEWFAYCETGSARLSPGSQVEFCLDSVYHFQSKAVYSSISTTGRAFTTTRSGRLVHIANIDFAC
ncbi:hypothetical protein GGH92_010746, partial [Coemansia sp. RSA 2673]